MKEKIYAAIMTLVVLASTTGLWLTYKGKVTFFTDLKPETEVLFQYRKQNDDKLISVTALSKPDGRVSFDVSEKKLSYFKAVMPEKTEIRKVQFRGLKKQNLSLTEQNEYTGKPLKGMFSYTFVYVVFFAYFSFLFMLNGYKNRHQAEAEERLPKILNIEFLRILFTIGVVCHHFFKNFDLYQSGGQGVEFFFILSGFFLSLTFNPDRTMIEYAKSKIIRWLPLIVFGGFLIRPNLSSVFYPIFFLQSTGLAYQYTSNAPAWYLGVLFWVSVFYLSVFKVMSKEQRNLFIGTITFICFILCARTADSDNTWNMVFSYFPRRLLLGMACVGLGCMLQQVCFRKENAPVRKWVTFVEFAVLIYLFLDIFVTPMIKEWIFKPIFHAVLLYLFIRKEGAVSNFFEKRIFAKMARYCLSVYLTHAYIVGIILFSYEDKLKSLPVFVVIFCMLTAAVLMGVFAHHVIEKPATKALKKWLG